MCKTLNCGTYMAERFIRKGVMRSKAGPCITCFPAGTRAYLSYTSGVNQVGFGDKLLNVLAE